ncbi:MAG: SGNH/GDSL hydrolase family protein [Muribaculaceae bacterium]|nr:SGNH/GDSL hydrolase family protein [Muribaculaceae bacterium]
MKNLLICLFMAILGATAAFAAETDSVRVLFIGNSYTYYNDMPEMLRKLSAGAANSEKLPIAYRKFTPGGCTLKRHCDNTELRKTIAGGGWDFVVIQEQSSAPAQHSATVARHTYPFAHTLDSLVHAASPNAQVIFYMTWGHKDGCQSPHEGYPLIDTYDGMQQRLADSYLEMAYDNDARCAPVGLVWKRVRTERPYETLYKPDRSHPSQLGSYLAANVIFATMLGRNYQSSFTAGLEPSLCEYIQTVAQETVLSNKHLLNIKD